MLDQAEHNILIPQVTIVRIKLQPFTTELKRTLFIYLSIWSLSLFNIQLFDCCKHNNVSIRRMWQNVLTNAP